MAKSKPINEPSPAPWTNDDWDVIDADGHPVASIVSVQLRRGGGGRTRANRTLIIAAPELLAACDAAVAALTMPSLGLGNEALLKLATAIAKAKGS